jgi:Protein of unknown function (DUF3108)
MMKWYDMRRLRNNWSRLLAALLLSLLVHLWLAGGLRLVMPEQNEADPIVVRLVNPPPVKPAPPPAEAPKPEVVAKPKPQPAPQAKPAPRAEPTPPLEPEALPLPSLAAATLPEPEPPREVEQAPVVEQPYIPAEEEKLPPPPRHVEIDFQILRKGGTAGVERQKYQVADDGSYVLQSKIEPKGLLTLFVSNLVQKSEGMVTERGLRPSSFLYQYGNNADKSRAVTFDWQAGTVTMEAGSKRRTAELLEGAQDMMSFMYQFMFVPPLQEMRLAVTNGKKLKIYEYYFEGEEMLDTGVGKLRTWRIGRSSGDGEEKTELWLAVDYHYLPVKIDITEKDGTLTERVASRLQIE